MAIGRITGRMLKTPLERNSTDLVLSTDAHANTLKIDATNGRIGIRHSSPSHGLTVDGIGIDGNIIETIDSNADLELRAAGTGKVSISGLLYPSTDGSQNQFLQTDGAGNLAWATVSLGDLSVEGSTLQSPSNADITLSPGGTGSVVINSISIRDNIIQTNESNANLQLSANGTGTVLINSLSFPTGTGSNGQSMITDGNGNLSFSDLTVSNITDLTATATELNYTDGVTSNIQTQLDAKATAASPTFTGDVTFDTDTLTIGSQVIYAQGNNGFSVNEDFDPSNSSTQTAYHYTTGAGRETLAFTLARTGQFTDGFGIYGTSANNTFVTFGEQSNTSFEWRRGVGIQPLDLDGGTLMMRLSSAGDLTINNDITVQGSVFADSIQSTGSNANIVLDPQGSGKVILSGLSFPTADGSNGQVLATDGAGNLTFTDLSVGDLIITGSTIATPSNADLVLDPGGTGSVQIEQGTQAGITLGDLDGNYKSKTYLMWGTTSDATETEIFIAGNTNSRIPVNNNTTISYVVNIVARRTDVAGESASFELKAVADNFSGTTADVGNVYEVVVARDDANYSVDARADDTNDSVNIYVTGVAGKTIAWMAKVETVEVSQ